MGSCEIRNGDGVLIARFRVKEVKCYRLILDFDWMEQFRYSYY